MNKDIEKSLGLASNQKILGFLYVGTPCGKVKKIPEIKTDDFVSKLQ